MLFDRGMDGYFTMAFLDLLLPLLVRMVSEGEGVLRILTKKHSLECIDLALTTMHVLLLCQVFI